MSVERMPKFKHLNRLSSGRVFAILVVLAAAIAPGLYVFFAAPDFVSRDQWRFVEMIRHWNSGIFELAELWETHSSHRVPGYKAAFLLNALWFDLNPRIENLAGFILQVSAAYLLVRYIQQRLEHYALARLLGAVAMAVIALSLSMSYFFNFSLLTLNAGASAALFVATLILVERYCSVGNTRNLVLASIIWFAGTLLFGAGKTPAMAASLLVVLGVQVVLLQGATRRRFTVAFMLLSLITVLEQLIYWYGLDSGDSAVDLGKLFAQPARILEFLTKAFGVTTFGPDFFVPLNDRAPLIAVITGSVVFVIAMLATFAWLFQAAKQRNRHAEVVSPVLIAYAVAIMSSVMLVRADGGTNIAMAPRYTHESHFLLIGATGLLLLVVHGRWRNWMAGAILAGILSVEIFSAHAAFRILPFRENGQQAVRETLVRAGKSGSVPELPRWFCPSQQICEAEIRYMATHGLGLHDDTRKASN